MTRYVIIGLGVAGLAAVEVIRKKDKTGEITIISADPHGYYSRPGLAYYLTGEVTDSLLYAYPPEGFKKLNANFKRGHVIKIKAEQHALELDDRHHLTYDRLLIATGASAVTLTAPGAHLAGVVKLDHLEDAKKIVALARKSRTAVVVGGGITALELVEGLSAQGVKVHYLLRGDRYWGNVLDETESRIVEHRLKEEGVILHFNTELAEVLEKEGMFGKTKKIGAIRTTDNKIIKCDLLAYAIGVTPRITLAREAGIKCDKGILTDEYLQTNVPDIFAAGDAAQVFDQASGRAVIDSLWGPAREQGHVAGLNMAGQRVAYRKLTPFNVTRLAGLTTTIIGAVGGGRNEDVLGIARGDSETWRQIPDAIIAQTGFDVNRLRVMVGQHTLLGAIVMGDQKLSSPLETLIRDQVDITAIHDKLLHPGAQIADILAAFWAEWKTQHAA